MTETKQFYKPIHPSKETRQKPNQQFEGSEDYDHVVDRKTGWKWYKEQQGNLPHTSSTIRREVYTEYTPVACIMNNTVNGSGLQHHHCANENSLVIWSAMSSPCWPLPHLLTSSPPQHEAQPGQHDLLQDDTVHRAPLPQPIQSTSSANEPLSHVNYESGRNPRNTSPTGYEP